MDDGSGIAGILSLANAGETGKAAVALGDLWNRALKKRYAHRRMNARPADIKRLLALEEEIAGPDGSYNELDLARMVDLYRRGDIPASAVPGRRTYAVGLAFDLLVEMATAAERDGRIDAEEIELWTAALKLFLRDADPAKGAGETSPAKADEAPAPTICPKCRALVRNGWTFCPACENPLPEICCARCRKPMNPSWKRCPTCGGAPWRDGKTLTAFFSEPVTDMTFVFVPGGVFFMGDETGDGAENETPVHRVELDGFYLGKYPVTQGQWRKVMEANPSKFQLGDAYPVESVSFEDVKAFIRRLEELNGGEFRFRLPTEAEWEYAARSGGRKELYSGGDDADAVAWSRENSSDSTRPVGRKRPNGLDLHDMSGNVWEWCEDVFTEDAYQLHDSGNPLIVKGGSDRVIRGGNWRLDAWSCRCTRRFGMAPDYSGSGLGLRLAAEKIRK